MCEAKAAASALHHNCGIRIREFGAHQRRAAFGSAGRWDEITAFGRFYPVLRELNLLSDAGVKSFFRDLDDLR
jgi:hypothetical protein